MRVIRMERRSFSKATNLAKKRRIVAFLWGVCLLGQVQEEACRRTKINDEILLLEYKIGKDTKSYSKGSNA